MAIERMKLLSVVGKEENIDSFIAKYLLDSGMQPEDALKVLEKGWKLSNFPYDIKPQENIKKCKSILNKLKIPFKENFSKVELVDSIDEIEEELNYIELNYNEKSRKIEEAEKALKKIEEVKDPIEHIKNIELELEEIYKLRYMKFRFGKLKKEYYERIKQDIKSLDAILLELEQEDDIVWIVYLTTEEFSMQVDSYFNIMKFERIWLPQEIKGSPKDFIKNIEKFKQTNLNKIETQKKEIENLKLKQQVKLISYLAQLETYSKINKIKKYIVHDENGYFYVIGWIPLDELKQLMPKLVNEKDIKFTVKNHDEVASIPPTHLKNGNLFGAFETIVNMYGVPNYTELDPTAFVAITAFLMFGFMFGDVGQGLVILLIGLFIKKKSSLGSVFIAGGLSAMIFGILYGSIFGKEGLIKPLLISPMENINTMLISGIAFGTILILIAMILNIKNGIRNKDKKKIFFSENGIAGFIFYCTILVSVVYFFLKGKLIVSGTILGIILGVALFCILFKEPIVNKIEHNKRKEKTSMIESIFELIETLLSFASNTISFVRLSAFAINHVGLCMAVYILAGLASGAGNLAVAIIGNILVIVLEGLIVAIQVLRLEYYELFSRFYSGDGKEYKPIRSEIN